MIENVEIIKLRMLVESLPHGSQMRLATLLDCDQSKITRAKFGLVRSRTFLERLETEARKIHEERMAALS